MRQTVTTAEEATAVLDYYNAFHDGFVRRLAVASHDVFEAVGVQAHRGALDLEMLIAHYNYQSGTKPATQEVRATFRGVRDLVVSFSGLAYEWSINRLDLAGASRKLEDGRLASCLLAVLVQPRLSPAREWQLHEDVTFTFESAEFEEL
jgi:hypothetical protein